jgi:hypothetical protein
MLSVVSISHYVTYFVRVGGSYEQDTQMVTMKNMLQSVIQQSVLVAPLPRRCSLLSVLVSQYIPAYGSLASGISV